MNFADIILEDVVWLCIPTFGMFECIEFSILIGPLTIPEVQCSQKCYGKKVCLPFFFAYSSLLIPPWMDVIAVQRASVHVRGMRTQGSFAIGLKILKVHYCSIKIKYLQLY